MNETYIRDKYDVSALECAAILTDIIKSAPLAGIQISRTEYSSRINTSLSSYADAKSIDTNWSKAKVEHSYIVRHEEPSFDWWFAIYLSLIDSYKIPLVLDEHRKRWNRPQTDFANFIENFILRIQENNLFHDFVENKKEIVTWIRDHRKSTQASTSQNNVVINIQNNISNEFNFQQYFNNHYYSSSSTFEGLNNTGDSIGVSTLFNTPYLDFLYEELSAYCNEDHKENLKKLLLGENGIQRVELKSNFKKKSLREAMKLLIMRGDCHMSQEECSGWLFKHFVIKSTTGFDEFKVNGTKDVFRSSPTQTDKSQLKFDDWYKK